jgi:hypothetical protein
MPNDSKSRVKNRKQYEENLIEILKNKSTSVAKKTKIVKQTDHGIATRYYY